MVNTRGVRVLAAVAGVSVLGACIPPRGEPPVRERSVALTPDPLVFSAPGGAVNTTVEYAVVNDGQVGLRNLEFSTVNPAENAITLSIVSDDCPTVLATAASCTVVVGVVGTVDEDDDTGRVAVVADADPPFPAPGYTAVFEVDLILI